MTIVKSPTHAENLVSRVAELLDEQRKYSDVQVTAGGKTFYCHKLVLALRSKYFEQNFIPIPRENQMVVINIDSISFQNVVRYIYTGEIELSSENVQDIHTAADELGLDELRQMCVDYMMESVSVDNCIRYWKLAERTHETKLARTSKEIFLTGFSKTSQSAELCEMTEEMMKAAISDDSLCANREIDVCEMLMKWLDIQTKRALTVQTHELLSLIRWSDVPVQYVKTRLLNRDVLIRDRKSFEFLSKVISYHLTGVQFPGLRTFHRTIAQQQWSVVTVGISDCYTITSEVYRVSLQRPDSVHKLPDIPTEMQKESAACVNNDMLYVTGVGSDKRQTWMWNFISGWSRCGDLVEGRRRHCATFVNNTEMYVLGGFDEEVCMKSVEQFKTTTNRWSTVGQLTRAVCNAACVVHKTSIFIFGGGEINTVTKEHSLDCVQMFDTVTDVCTVLAQRLSRPERLLRAVIWDGSVILMNNRTCLVFDLERQTFQRRDQFAPGVAHIGLVVENENIVVVGGGTDSPDEDGKMTWTLSDVVKRVPVMDIINNTTTANWVQHAKLPRPYAVDTFGCCSLIS